MTAARKKAANDTATPRGLTLAENVRALLLACEQSEGEFTAAIRDLGWDLENKVEAYVATYDTLEAEARALKDLAALTAERAQRKLQRAEQLRANLLEAFKTLGVDRVKTPTACPFIQGYDHVEISDEAAFCADPRNSRYVVVVPAHRRPSKGDIKAAIKAGVVVPHASIVREEKVTMR